LRNNQIFIIAASILVAFAISACVAEQTENATGDDSTSDTLPPVNSPALGQKILFEYTYINFAWGFQCYGYYVDSGGNVWKYRYGEDDGIWQPEDPNNLSESQLLGKYSHNPVLAATVDRETVHQMAALIPAAAAGELTDRRNEANDMGSIVYLAYTFDPSSRLYHPVRLLIGGDWYAKNDAPEADSLLKWFRTIPIDWQD